MKIQISDVMKSALHARCGERYIVQERGEIDIYVSLVQLSLILISLQVSVGDAARALLCYLIRVTITVTIHTLEKINMPSEGYRGTDEWQLVPPVSAWDCTEL